MKGNLVTSCWEIFCVCCFVSRWGPHSISSPLPCLPPSRLMSYLSLTLSLPLHYLFFLSSFSSLSFCKCKVPTPHYTTFARVASINPPPPATCDGGYSDERQSRSPPHSTPKLPNSLISKSSIFICLHVTVTPPHHLVTPVIPLTTEPSPQHQLPTSIPELSSLGVYRPIRSLYRFDFFQRVSSVHDQVGNAKTLRRNFSVF